jgi:membrane protein DedA with SNARE-associated domain/rhodanese-related sulfurtransferase
MFSHELIAQYGALVAFWSVLGASLGLPVLAMPTLITIGASITIAAGTQHTVSSHFASTLGAAALGGLIGDLVWYLGGRLFGERALRTVCLLSLSRDTCVRKTERFFERCGVQVLIVARFVPGLSLVAVPLCGAMAIRLRNFIACDCAGVTLWASIALAIGGIFGGTFANQIEVVTALISHTGWRALAVLACALVLYYCFRYRRSLALSKALRTARIDAVELHGLLTAEPRPVILDIRSPERRMLVPFVIPGAVFADRGKFGEIIRAYDANRTFVIYCSCPGEVSAAWMAGRLQRAGIRLALPLTGGIDAWRKAGFHVAPAPTAGGQHHAQ